MGQLIVIEGLDGSGKRTLTESLAGQWRAAGRTVATMAFPRYGIDLHADLVQDALYGRLGDLAESVYGPALLFALDRRAAAPAIRDLLRSNDVLLLDRYVTSNAAYGSARLGGPAVDSGFAQWVRELEIDRFGIPLPDRQILLATPLQVAAERARDRAAGSADRALDSFESDSGLQERTGAMYRLLAVKNYLSPWTVLTPETDGSLRIPAELAG